MTELDNNSFNDVSKPELEQVQKEKQEYKLINRILRTKGLNLYDYCPDGKIKEVVVRKIETLELECNEHGELVPKDINLGDSVIDSKNIHFESLNMKNAEKRVRRWKEGKIKELENLKEYNPKSLI